MSLKSVEYYKYWLPIFVIVLGPFLTNVRGEEIPAAIQNSIALLNYSAKSSSVEAYKFLGESFYGIELTSEGKPREWTFDAAGVPVNVQVFRDELPPAVESTLQQEIAKGQTVEEISRSFENGSLIYEVELASDKVTRLLCIRPNGSVTTREISLSQIPRAVSKQLKVSFSAKSAEKFYQSEEDQSSYFTAAFPNDGFPLWVTFDADGSLTEREERISWESTPETVQQSIMGRIKRSNSLRILRKTTPQEVRYEVWAVTPQKVDIFWLDPSGAVHESNGSN